MTYAAGLTEYEEILNDLNVFPIADHDTGTNMRITVAGAANAARRAADDSLHAISRAIVDGAFRSAQGNSGVLFSEWIRGFCLPLDRIVSADHSVVSTAMRSASESARAALANPVRGTLITVAADAAAATQGVTDMVALWRGASDAARSTVADTPNMLAALSHAGVVDAGGAALELLFDLAAGVEPVERFRSHGCPTAPAPQTKHSHEVIVVIETNDITKLREAWSGLGDSIVFSGGSGVWKCHIHSREPNAVIDAARGSGRVVDVEQAPH